MDDEAVRDILRRICENEEFTRMDAFSYNGVLRSRSHIALASLSDSTVSVHNNGRRLLSIENTYDVKYERKRQVTALAGNLSCVTSTSTACNVEFLLIFRRDANNAYLAMRYLRRIEASRGLVLECILVFVRVLLVPIINDSAADIEWECLEAVLASMTGHG